MPIRESLVNNEIYHVIIRGVADMPIFKNDQDRFRAIFSIFEFNNDRPVEIRERREQRRKKGKTNGGRASVESTKAERIKMVDILAFCLMPNHIHLLLRQKIDNGIIKFMRKFGTGYAGYFNKKHNRKGYLFQGRFKSIRTKSQSQLLVIFSYIHTNPVSLIEPKWKEKGIKNLQKTIHFLENYKWSSYGDYLSKQNFPSVTERDFLLGVLQGKNGCRRFINDWLKHKKTLNYDLSNLSNLE